MNVYPSFPRAPNFIYPSRLWFCGFKTRTFFAVASFHYVSQDNLFVREIIMKLTKTNRN